MTSRIRIALESGPKGKKVVAVAPDWPGLARGGKTEAEAVERVLAYVPRYAPVAKLAGLEATFPKKPMADVVERYAGPGSTDFWGISFGFSSIDQAAVPAKALERELTLLRACWAFFDAVRARVSAELQKGPRGGGRDRDQIARHVFANEQQWAKGIGVFTPDEALLTGAGLKVHRDAYCSAIRDYHAQGKRPGKLGKWPLRYMIRHTAFHTLDHAWEMEDKDLSQGRASS
jgi:hypothetical protein